MCNMCRTEFIRMKGIKGEKGDIAVPIGPDFCDQIRMCPRIS
jgi:hypothetical protein